MNWIVGSLLFWIVAWAVNARLSRRRDRWVRFVVPALFGITIIVLWEGMVRGFGINPVLLPAPSAIAVTFAAEITTLWGDLVQTFFKGALSGYVIGCAAAISMSPDFSESVNARWVFTPF